MIFDVKSIKYPKNYQLVNFIHKLGPHGHRDWPSDKKSINKIIEKGTSVNDPRPNSKRVQQNKKPKA